MCIVNVNISVFVLKRVDGCGFLFLNEFYCFDVLIIYFYLR